MFICKFNRLGNIKMLECFLLRLSGIFCIYTRLVLCRSIEFFNTVVTVRNESRQILAYLMHFCSNHVILCDRLFAVLAIHLYQKVFSALPLVFFSIFFYHVPTQACSSPLSGFCTLCNVFCSGFFSSSLVSVIFHALAF